MKSESSPPRILVIRGGAIGDFILTLPAMRLIRESLPACRLEVLGYPGICELALKAGVADSVRSLEHRGMAPLFARAASVTDDVADYFRGFNLVVSYLYDPDGHFRASLERIGVKSLIECPHRVEPGKGHAAAQLARPLQRLAMYLEGEAARRQQIGVPGGVRRRIAIHPGSGSLAKNWPLEHWIALGRSLAKPLRASGRRLTLITGEAERERGTTEAITGAWRDVEHDHWDALPLTELADRFQECEALLGHDSGISHLAAACGARCLLLFGPTDPDVWAPPQPWVQVLHATGGVLTNLGLDHAASEVIRWIAPLAP